MGVDALCGEHTEKLACGDWCSGVTLVATGLNSNRQLIAALSVPSRCLSCIGSWRRCVVFRNNLLSWTVTAGTDRYYYSQSLTKNTHLVDLFLLLKTEAGQASETLLQLLFDRRMFRNSGCDSTFEFSYFYRYDRNIPSEMNFEKNAV